MKSVNRGVALLDAHVPGWYNQVDVSILNLHSSINCVLGQVYGHFGRALPVFRLMPLDRRTHRINLEHYGFNPGPGKHIASKKAWAKAIHKRRLQQAQTEQYTRTLSKGFEYPNVVVVSKEDALCSS